MENTSSFLKNVPCDERWDIDANTWVPISLKTFVRIS